MFCEETYTSIINNPGMRKNDECEHTATFIKTVVHWWKILIVKRIGVDVKFNGKLQAVLQDLLDERLNTILKLSEMALHLKGRQGNRYKQFTRETTLTIHHVCNGVKHHSGHFQQIP